mmetsp:Transcript_29008/g.81149  ORF Transcript_29008/g.81149 Transcript_29008/m.81149 type:complete len:183 (-) Transcript_29008:105-653(-)
MSSNIFGLLILIVSESNRGNVPCLYSLPSGTLNYSCGKDEYSVAVAGCDEVNLECTGTIGLNNFTTVNNITYVIESDDSISDEVYQGGSEYFIPYSFRDESYIVNRKNAGEVHYYSDDDCKPKVAKDVKMCDNFDIYMDTYGDESHFGMQVDGKLFPSCDNDYVSTDTYFIRTGPGVLTEDH